ncbi:hypothetical protein [Allochromatium vinosum]|uniref:Lipoprotein n=1 Tax=Allochromatium vinosum (strain ATCC 17899 / DSM 180 / NBRC 103801 / NCIMB 10441 / D) TaxID=572477 RepID=D3RWH6_ALLVD|nr:hypothetical protein [Allochromatium vinosum]ADC64188.1 hypothetical protein Alvin_3298 [Allochromatium vinosum DSM 180]
MRLFKLALIALAFMHGSAMAKCLPDPSFSDECRYPQGDAWCAEHDTNSPYAYSDQCLEKRSGNVAKAVIPQRFYGHWEQSVDACKNGSEIYVSIETTSFSTAAQYCELKKILTSSESYISGVFSCNVEDTGEYNENYTLQIKNGTLVVNDDDKNVFFYCK